MDLGGNRRGVDMGPSAVRYAGLAERLEKLGFKVKDRGNLAVADRAADSSSASQVAGWRATGSRTPVAWHAPEIARVCSELAETVAKIEAGGAMPIVIGGDDSIGMGTLAGLARSGRKPGVIWMDAHGDINTPETTPSGNVHGMPLAV